MNSKKLKIALIIESVILIISIAVTAFVLVMNGFSNGKEITEVYNQASPDGGYSLRINRVKGDFSTFGPAEYDVKLFDEGKRIHNSFSTDVSDDGGDGKFYVEWKDGEVVVIFTGSEQKDAVYIIPLK